MGTNIKIINVKIWQYKVTEYLAYLAIILVPLFYGKNHFSIFNSPKLVIMMGISLFMVIFFLWGNFKNKEPKISFSFLNITLLFFIIILSISSIFGIDPINSFFGWRNTMPLVTMYALAIFALITGSLIKKDKRILINLLAVSFITSIITILIYYTGLSFSRYPEDGSTMGNSSYLGEYILFNLFFGLVLFLYSTKRLTRILIIIFFVFTSISSLFFNKEILLGNVGLSEIIHSPLLLFGVANGAILGIGLSFLFTSFLFMVFSNKKILRVTGLILIVSLLVGVLFVGRQLVDRETKLYRVYTEEKNGNRFIAWDIAKQGLSDNLLLGNGYNNFLYNFNKYYDLDLYKKGYSVERFTQPHNIVWEFASNNGILGLVGYLGLLSILFISLINIKNKEDKKLNNLRIILAGLLFGYFVQSLFVFDTINTYITLFIIISIGLGLSRDYDWRFGDKFIIVNKVLIIISILFCLYLMNILVFAPWGRSKEMNRMMNYTYKMTELKEVREKLQDKSIFGGVMENTFIASKFFDRYLTNLYQVNEENKMIFTEEIDSIVLSLEKDILIEPNYSEAYTIVSQLLNLHLLAEIKNGDSLNFDGKSYDKEIWERSYNSLLKSIELSPNNPQTYITLSELYMIKGDFDNARLYIKKSIEMAPEYKDFYIFARSLEKIDPNKDFEKFINEMEEKWVIYK